jgi:hypothetical protein
MTFSAFAFANSFFFERIRDYLEPNVREQLPLGTKSTTDPDSAIHRYCSREKPFVLGRKILPFGIPAVCTDRSVDVKCALNANHTASRKKLASHAQRVSDVPVNFS